MQDSNDNNNEVTTYKASGNLNVSIGIPSMNVNDTMNMNIQSVNTNPTLNNNTVNSDNNIQKDVGSVPPVTNTGVVNAEPDKANLENKSEEVNTDSSVKKTFVSNEEKAKKKKVSINLGPELKIALLIIVILLAFVFLLPLIA